VSYGTLAERYRCVSEGNAPVRASGGIWVGVWDGKSPIHLIFIYLSKPEFFLRKPLEVILDEHPYHMWALVILSIDETTLLV